MGWEVGTRGKSLEGMIPRASPSEEGQRYRQGTQPVTLNSETGCQQERSPCQGREGNLGVREDSRLCLESLWDLSPPRGTVQGRFEANGYPRPRQWLDLGCGNQNEAKRNNPALGTQEPGILLEREGSLGGGQT